MFEDHSHRLGQTCPEAGARPHNDRAQIAKAREAANALFAPKRKTVPTAESLAPEPESPSGEGPRKSRVLRALPREPARDKPSAAPAPAERPKPAKISAVHLPRIRTWLKYGMTVSQVAELYGVPVADITRLLQAT